MLLSIFRMFHALDIHTENSHRTAIVRNHICLAVYNNKSLFHIFRNRCELLLFFPEYLHLLLNRQFLFLKTSHKRI